MQRSSALLPGSLSKCCTLPEHFRPFPQTFSPLSEREFLFLLFLLQFHCPPSLCLCCYRHSHCKTLRPGRRGGPFSVLPSLPFGYHWDYLGHNRYLVNEWWECCLISMPHWETFLTRLPWAKHVVHTRKVSLSWEACPKSWSGTEQWTVGLWDLSMGTWPPAPSQLCGLGKSLKQHYLISPATHVSWVCVGTTSAD